MSDIVIVKWILGFDRCAKKYKVVGFVVDDRVGDHVNKPIIFTVSHSEASGWRTFGVQMPWFSLTAVGEKSIWLLSH